MKKLSKETKRLTKIKNQIKKIEAKAKERKIYSKIDELPRGHASNTITDGVILLQGGAFRGVYTSGVLDYLMLNDINFKTVIGVSAGALNGMNYVSGDIGRSALINLEHRHDPSWIGYKALRCKENNGFIGFSYVFKDFNREYPFSIDKFFDGKRELLVSATSLKDGKNYYFKNESKTIYHAVMASASMPYISKPVFIDKIPYLDGGCYDSLPIDYVLDNYKDKKIVVVLTRPLSFRLLLKDNKRLDAINNRIYRRYPEFVKALKNMDPKFNESFNTVERLFNEGKIFVIAPSENVTVTRLERDVEKLGDLYQLGYNDMKNNLDKLKEYLNK